MKPEQAIRGSVCVVLTVLTVLSVVRVRLGETAAAAHEDGAVYLVVPVGDPGPVDWRAELAALRARQAAAMSVYAAQLRPRQVESEAMP